MHRFTFAALVLTFATGCGSWSSEAGPAPAKPAAKHAVMNLHAKDAVVMDVGHAGEHSITVNVVPPSSGTLRTQAVVHKWVDNDIYEYEATLRYWNGSAYVDFGTPLVVVVPRKGASPKTSAVFTNLKHNYRYQVSVTAKGNNGGTAASTVLNSTPGTAIFDFTASQDVENSPSANVQVTLDPVPFNGTGTTNLTAPADGTYANPGAAETGTAV